MVDRQPDRGTVGNPVCAFHGKTAARLEQTVQRLRDENLQLRRENARLSEGVAA